MVILAERGAGVRRVGDHAAVADDAGYLGERPASVTCTPAGAPRPAAAGPSSGAARGRATVVRGGVRLLHRNCLVWVNRVNRANDGCLP